MLRKVCKMILFAAILLVLSRTYHTLDAKPEICARGVDVSSHQGKIDWEIVSQHISFAILRCGVNSGNGFRADPYFEENYAGACAAGLDVGCYLYTAATDRMQMCADVRSALDLLGHRALTMPFFLDIEDKAQKRLLSGSLTNLVSEGCGMIEAEGYPAGVYSYYAFLHRDLNSRRLEKEGYRIWMARYPQTDQPAKPEQYNFGANYRYWQYSDKGQIPGISVPVDLDVMYHQGVE